MHYHVYDTYDTSIQLKNRDIKCVYEKESYLSEMYYNNIKKMVSSGVIRQNNWM